LLVWGAAVSADDAANAKYRSNFDVFFRKLDTNKDGRLSKEEFLKIADRAKEKSKAREKLARVFEMLDPEHHGITKERFKAYLDSKNTAR
jgi:Ca2+-binding EF-hand superfamily protein